mmetsp:Transcript_39207/g.97116  ORF Transcript_39207/g.97116 Transcript_39207/m.97116 type:complete len:228 (+) Transcript_39207:17-700(+)
MHCGVGPCEPRRCRCLLGQGPGTVTGDVLNTHTIGLEPASGQALGVLLAVPLGETPLAGEDDLLAPGELELGAAHGLDAPSLVDIARADGDQDVPNLDAGHHGVGLAVGMAHTGLKAISTGAGQHLVDADHVVGVGAHAHVETLTAAELGQALVGSDTGSLQGVGGNLLTLVGDKVDHEGEVRAGGGLSADIINADLGVGDTTAVPGLNERLVLAVPVALGRSSAHG